uniref:ORF 171 protein n=1 Tax=Saccharomyces cerevisiae TaxID=4932 RepID=A2NY34_YEASX|nr:ORF 171 [Saccharomyces cerevisiae]
MPLLLNCILELRFELRLEFLDSIGVSFRPELSYFIRVLSSNSTCLDGFGLTYPILSKNSISSFFSGEIGKYSFTEVTDSSLSLSSSSESTTLCFVKGFSKVLLINALSHCNRSFFLTSVFKSSLLSCSSLSTLGFIKSSGLMNSNGTTNAGIAKCFIKKNGSFTFPFLNLI